ncbi:MAG TPA: penicillin-binding transpeptidase domain-containing protein [Pyrinomonadaceae bacterium]|nr:penicillin-binding transpeptidase domain-containing protein [Pyrinomonadaceae bacterium]
MKLMRSRKLPSKLSFSLFLALLLLCSVSFPAQSKKHAAAKKAAVKKTERTAKDARKNSAKGSKKEQLAKKASRTDSKRDKTSAKNKKDAKRDDKRDKVAAKKDKSDRADRKDSKNRKDPKRLAELRRAEAERRAAAEARRQAALAEQRRREQIAREARARHIAFERGLRTETANNINNDITDGEDLAVRRAAIEGLGSRAGTVVVMEAKTGKILTIVNQEWAIRNAFKPCSTIKLVTGVAGVNEHVINEDGHIGNSNGMILQDALAHSNNAYFQRVGSNLGSKKLIEYAKTLGLGEPTGLNAAGETGGRLPYGNNNARIYSHGDDFEVTPLQLAVLVSALSNGGKKVVPQVPHTRVERSVFRPQIAEQVNLPAHTIEGMLPGMAGAAEYGTARRGVDASMGVAGKTGSCITKGSWIGLFASVAPVEDPKYSVVVITRGEGERGKYAAAVAGHVYQVLRGQIRRNPERSLAFRHSRPSAADSRTAAAVADEDDDDSDSAEAASIPAPMPANERRIAIPVQPAPKKMIQRTTQSKPKFSPVVIEFDRSGVEKTRPRVVKNK